MFTVIVPSDVLKTIALYLFILKRQKQIKLVQVYSSRKCVFGVVLLYVYESLEKQRRLKQETILNYFGQSQVIMM